MFFVINNLKYCKDLLECYFFFFYVLNTMECCGVKNCVKYFKKGQKENN
jgi:hypothetical protein